MTTDYESDTPLGQEYADGVDDGLDDGNALEETPDYGEAYAEDDRMYPGEEQTHYYPGDGMGTDDLADYNANEADDYRDE